MRRVLEPVLAVTAGTVPSVVPRRAGRPPSRFHVPQVGEGAVERAQLLERVSAAVRGPLTLVSAAAGSGKTTLLAAWAARQQSPGPLLWMTVEVEDSRPDVFWSGLVDGLARADPSLAGLDLDDPARPVDRALLDALVWRLTEQDTPWVVVLDDAHHLTDRQVGEDLAYLLRACEGHLRLVLLTRVDPPLPLHRYRLDGVVTELRQEDLAFTGAEIGELLRSSGLEPSEAAQRHLLERTGGWVAGVRFAARALHEHPGHDAPGPDARGGEDGAVAYLEAEVLDPLPAELREAILRCAVVDALEPGLAEALAGGTDSDRLLERLLAAGTLLVPDHDTGGDGGGRPGLRFQPQLRELARARLADEGPDALPAAHRRAARWYAERGRLEACVEHAARAGAWELAAASAVDGLAVVTSLAGTTDSGLSQLGRVIPDDVDGLPAALVRAARAVLDGDGAGLSAELGRARTGLAADAPGLHARLLTLAVLEATSALRAGDEGTASGALATGELMLRRLASVPPARRAQAAALLTVLRCERDLLRGDMPGVLRGATDPRLGPELLDHLPGVLLARVRAASALARCLTGQLRRGGSGARLVLGPAAHAGGLRPGVPSDGVTDRCLARSCLALAWAATEAYDLDAAEVHAAAAEQRGAGEDRVDATVLALVRARVLRAHGDQASATEVLRAVRAAGRALPLAWDARVLGALSAGGTDAVQGGTDGRSSSVPAASAAAEPLTLGVRLELLVQRAARAEQAGDRDRALALLDRALRLGEPERLRRPFVESPVAVRRLLRTAGTLPTSWLSTSTDPGRAARERAATSVSAGAVARDGGGAEGHGGHGGHGPLSGVEPGDRAGGQSPRVSVGVSDGSYERLTAKELEVLGHLADLLSTVEVAAVMFVSVNTVRTHVRSILRKLDVARRHEAVRRAWELGLLTAGSQAGAGRRAAVPPGTVGVSGAEDA